jgi:hypothetical protein
VTPLQYLNILRAADNYALVAARVAVAKKKAKLTGDSEYQLTKKRDAARSRLVAVMEEARAGKET